jgi:phosphoglycolate phosphatase
MKRETLALVSGCGVETDSLAALDILSIVEAARERLEASGQTQAGDRLRADAFALLQRIETKQCASPTEVPGASELLFRLRARGIPVGIVTRNCRVVSERLLQIGNLPCDALVTRDDVPRTKPDPLHLLTTLQLLEKGSAEKRLLPSSAVMVGDHWMDIQAGRAAGMRTIGILRGRDADFFAPAPPDRLIYELSELLLCTGENIPHEPSDPLLRQPDHPLHRHR